MTRNGCLVLANRVVGGNHHGSRSFLQDTIDAANTYGIRHERLTADEIQRRFPQFRLTAEEDGYFEPGAGFLRPELCVETQLEQARKLGATVKTSEMVLEVKRAGNAVSVVTDKGRYEAAKVILTAGPWIAQFLSSQYAQQFRVYRQTLCWFEIAQNHDCYTPERFPVFIWITGSRVQDMLYGFPAVNGTGGGVKVATETYDETVHPDAVPREVSETSVAGMFKDYIAERLPDLSKRCLRTATCLYTVTPDAKFVIDYADVDERILFASACSGHGFKHSPAIGEALAQRALGLSLQVDLSPFAVARLPSL